MHHTTPHHTTPALICLLVALALATPSSALHCNGEITTIATPLTSFYIDDRSDEAGEFNHWTYMESNGIHGLQSGGIVYLDPFGYCWEPIPCLVDGCWHRDPDQLIL